MSNETCHLSWPLPHLSSATPPLSPGFGFWVLDLFLVPVLHTPYSVLWAGVSCRSCAAASSGYILCALICPNKRYVFSKYAYAGRQRIVSARRQLLLQLFLASFRWQSASQLGEGWEYTEENSRSFRISNK